jgi:hypothetical protein
MVVCGRFLEVGDDELAFAYHCANEPNRDYDRAKANKAYTRVGAGLYRRAHLDRAVGMMLKASGVSPEGRFGDVARRLAWFHLQRQHRRAAAA